MAREYFSQSYSQVLGKSREKYRNGTFRAQWWDYSWNGSYFITICTQNKEPILSTIQDASSNVELTSFGEIAS
jgi:hypothetical protein